MALEMQLDYRLRWLDFDRYGHILPVSVLDIFQDAATQHAEQIGIGRSTMMETGVFWVVVRSKYEVLREPQYFQKVTVKTWPHSPTNVSFARDFYMLDENGQLLIKATTEWVLMDATTRKFARMKDHYHGPTNFSDERAFEGKLRKLRMFEEGNRPPFTVTPTYSDIDLNGHVNNARYLNFVMNAWNPGPHEAIRSLQIDYRLEALPNQPLRIVTLAEPGTVQLKGLLEDDMVSFACTLQLQEE